MSDQGFFATLRRESAVVPAKLRTFCKFLAIAGLVLATSLELFAAVMFVGKDVRAPELSVGSLAIAIGCSVVAIYLMLLGYVYGDARRRGMPAGLWVVLVLLIPNLIGFIVYLILRRSIFAPCPNCGRGCDLGQI